VHKSFILAESCAIHASARKLAHPVRCGQSAFAYGRRIISQTTKFLIVKLTMRSAIQERFF